LENKTQGEINVNPGKTHSPKLEVLVLMANNGQSTVPQLYIQEGKELSVYKKLTEITQVLISRTTH